MRYLSIDIIAGLEQIGTTLEAKKTRTMSGDPTSILLSIALIRIVAWLTPGPNMLAVAHASISNGRYIGILTGWGIAFGGFVWASLAVVGVSALFTAFPEIVRGIRLIGATYLLWLGYKSLKSAFVDSQDQPSALPKFRNGWSAFRSGFIVTATNPKAALFYGSIFTTFVPENAPASFLLIIVLMSGAIGVATYSLTATVFSLEPVMQLFARAQRKISAGIGLIFTSLGVGVAIEAFRRH